MAVSLSPPRIAVTFSAAERDLFVGLTATQQVVMQMLDGVRAGSAAA